MGLRRVYLKHFIELRIGSSLQTSGRELENEGTFKGAFLVTEKIETSGFY